MNKIKDAIIDKMVRSALTDAQISFLLVISRYQDDTNNRIYGAHHEQISREAHISSTTYYACIRDLEEKGFIKTVQNKEYGDWDIIILNNDFTYEGAFYEGYLDTNHEIFYNKEFYYMTAIQKLLTIDLLRICQSNIALKGYYRIGVNTFYDKYQEKFCTYAKSNKLTKRVLQNCLKALKKYFTMGIKNRMYWFKPLKEKIFQKETINRRTEEGVLKKFIGTTICRRLKLSYTKESFNDTTALLKQYSKICKQRNINTIDLLFESIKNSILKINEKENNSKNWKRELQPKMINKYMHKEIYAY